MTLEYEIGQKVWIAIGYPKLIPGTIIHKFQHNEILYVIEVDTSIDPVYYVREWSTISETKKGPLNLYIRGRRFGTNIKSQS